MTSAPPPVLPLRPMTVPDVLDGGFRLLRAAPGAVLVPALVVAVVVALLDAGVRFALDPAAALTRSAVGGFTSAALFRLVGTAVTTVGAAVVAAFLAGVLTCSLAGTAPTTRAVWAAVRGRLVTAVVVGVVVAVVQTLLLFLLVVPGVVAWVLLALAAPAVVVERAGPYTALKRSVQLVRTNAGRVFGLRLLAVLAGLAFGWLFSVPFSLVADAFGATPDLANALLSLGVLLSSAVTLPLRAAVDVVLYLDTRVRGEAFDVTVALSRPSAAPVPA